MRNILMIATVLIISSNFAVTSRAEDKAAPGNVMAQAGQESAGEYVDDSVITTRVKAAILDEPTLKTFQINVKSYKGIVQLSGFVDSAQIVKKAGNVAASIKGVKEVKNGLSVK